MLGIFFEDAIVDVRLMLQSFGERFSLQLVTIYAGVIPFVSYIGVSYKRYGFFSRFGLMKTDQPIRVLKWVPFSMEQQELIVWINLVF